MTISAKIIAHSRSAFHGSETAHCPDLITFQLRYPRFIHAEVMTHRLFSRNASSSRAIPVETMIKNIIADTAMPIHWGKNQSGMQAHEEQDTLVNIGDEFPHESLVTASAAGAWCVARDKAIKVATAFHKAGYHKQVVNRILEPFMHIDVIVTASNFDNFFWLRRHPDAQPEIRVLADAMWEALQASTPHRLNPGEWHLPYVREIEKTMRAPRELAPGVIVIEAVTTEVLIKLSVARCARVSYLTHDGKEPDFAKDVALYERLVGSEPLHASPAEHQAIPDEPNWYDGGVQWDRADLSGNFDGGWVQYRKTLSGEHCDKYEVV